MTDVAVQIQYRNEYIQGFEVRESQLRKTVTTDGINKGGQYVFLVADSNGATTVTRGVNGRIPTSVDNLNQYTVTLAEEHDLRTRTGFNIFESQGDGMRIMQENSMGVVNRRIDMQILGELQNTTYFTGVTAATATLDMVVMARTILGVNQVPLGSDISAVISPAFHGYLAATTEFANVQYVDNKQLPNMPIMFRWMGVNFVESPIITGVGTALEYCFMYHKSALGHAADTKGMQSFVGYDEEQDYSFARTSIYMGVKLLQAKGIVCMRHDGSKYKATA
jgi:Phage capsid protein